MIVKPIELQGLLDFCCGVPWNACNVANIELVIR